MRVFQGLLLGLLLLAGLPAVAQELGLYEGEVLVASQSEADRSAALPAALAQVLVKVGGDAASAGVAEEADAASLLQQYRYRQDMVRVEGAAQLRHYLIASFSQAGVQALLATQGRSAMPAQRPQPILWLAIDDGSGARIVSQDAAAAVAPLMSRATQRGLRVRLPMYDSQDRSIVHPRDISDGEIDAVDSASRRYGDPVLIGWMRRGEQGWLVDWRLREGGSDVGRWQSSDAQAATVLAAGADGAADAWAQRHSQIVLSGVAGRYTVVIEGLSEGADYAEVMQTLKRQPIVRGIVPLALSADRLELELELSAGVESLARLLEASGLNTLTLGDAKSPSIFSRQR